MKMTPEQKVKWLILDRAALFSDTKPPAYPCENVDELYSTLVESDQHWDPKNEVRSSGIETGLSCEYCRHYEAKAVATKMPDGSWVGWTYWYGGGKHGEPEAVDWIEHAYEVNCKEEEKMVTVRTFATV